MSFLNFSCPSTSPRKCSVNFWRPLFMLTREGYSTGKIQFYLQVVFLNSICNRYHDIPGKNFFLISTCKWLHSSLIQYYLQVDFLFRNKLHWLSLYYWWEIYLILATSRWRTFWSTPRRTPFSATGAWRRISPTAISWQVCREPAATFLMKLCCRLCPLSSSARRITTSFLLGAKRNYLVSLSSLCTQHSVYYIHGV